MKKFDRAFEMDVLNDIANDTCAKYAKYFIANNINDEDKANPLVKAYLEVVEIQNNRVYDCNTKDDFTALTNIVEKARKLLNE